MVEAKARMCGRAGQGRAWQGWPIQSDEGRKRERGNGYKVAMMRNDAKEKGGLVGCVVMQLEVLCEKTSTSLQRWSILVLPKGKYRLSTLHMAAIRMVYRIPRHKTQTQRTRGPFHWETEMHKHTVSRRRSRQLCNISSSILKQYGTVECPIPKAKITSSTPLDRPIPIRLS